MSTKADTAEPAYDTRCAIVIPTIGRPSLQRCVDALATASGPLPELVVVVDDRPDTPDPLPLQVPRALADRTTIAMTSGGRGPAAARNLGWRTVPATVPWIVFLDDDVEVEHFWRARLDHDLRVTPDVGAVQGVIHVPLPSQRRPTDWERNVAGLADARWITADLAYRRDALVESGGFDERFRRAFREDADLALRVQDAGWRLTVGQRRTRHPVRPADRLVSIRMQAGNADDVLMARLHGRDWYDRAEATRGARRRHLAVTALGTAALAAGAAQGIRGLTKSATASKSRQSAALRRAGFLAAAGWFAGTATFFAERVRPGPRTADELAAMAVSSAAIPPVATAHWLRGLRRYRHVHAESWPGRPLAVLFDRDGTLIHDVPYNTDPDRVAPMPTALEALRLLRDAGLRIGVVTNQSGIGRGLITPGQAKEVDEQVRRLLGPFDAWAVCPHTPEDGCDCRKPRPGLIFQAAAELGMRPEDCVVIGDIGADVAAARAAGSRSVLIPTPSTRIEELAGARIGVDLLAAARWIVGQSDPEPARAHRTRAAATGRSTSGSRR
ncbi:MAG TPA: HAD-IIIA family hydrolase [Actinocrinis sp.]|uniref:HAD-IIIA family hydrolase n=1 Tax=Actinocrinis sp. TaxID=1920516 RepID=UPI002D4AA834|nr:HAD-IIIA family hydrolase [Actinocrinis sp.]HZU56564.1 HAD-IIIA family hydrolase [Actinocrinis sp.]